MAFKKFSFWLIMSLTVANFISCSKSDSGGTPNPPIDKCAAKTINVTTTTVGSASCGNSGSITVAASGSTNFTYKLNSAGTYQTSNTFASLAAGSYTVFAKDGDGCEKSESVTVANAGQAGPLFSAVKALMSQRCEPCHNNSIANGGMNWAVDCNIVANKARIKVRAVDEGSMPPPPNTPLSASEKKVITDWINAGGLFSN